MFYFFIITWGTFSTTLLLILLALDVTGLTPGVPGVHGAVEHFGTVIDVDEQLYLKSVVWYAPAELLLLDTRDGFLNKAGWFSHFGSPITVLLKKYTKFNS